VDWMEVTFQEVCDWLSAQGKGLVNVIPRWTRLEVMQVTGSDLVTLTLNEVTIREVLDEVLDQLSEEGTLGYRARNNMLWISTTTNLPPDLIIRFYSLRDLSKRMGISPSATGESVERQGTGKGESPKQTEPRAPSVLEEIGQAIQGLVKPQASTDGNCSCAVRVCECCGGLFVRATPDMHAQIECFFFPGN